MPGFFHWVQVSGIVLIRTREFDFTTRDAQAGTPKTMAPDQVLPDAPEDPGCHLHSPGAILHRLLTGRLAIRAFRRASKVNPKVPRSFDRMILRAPQEDPDGRYPSAAAMLADIRTLQIP